MDEGRALSSEGRAGRDAEHRLIEWGPVCVNRRPWCEVCEGGKGSEA